MDACLSIVCFSLLLLFILVCPLTLQQVEQLVFPQNLIRFWFQMPRKGPPVLFAQSKVCMSWQRGRRDMQCWIRWAARQDSTQAKGWDHELLCWYDWSISDNARPERRLSCLIHVDQLNHVPIRIRNCRERIGLSERSQICQIQVQKEREDVKSRALTEVNFGLLF